MNPVLSVIHERRAVRNFSPVEIPPATRQVILEAATLAPSSYNLQPYRFYWVESEQRRKRVAECCLDQNPAVTASVLVVAVADVRSWRVTAAGQLAWMKESGFSAEKIVEYERKARRWKWFFVQGWFSLLGAMKWLLLRTLGLWKVTATPPSSHRAMLQWATKGTALACENLMIAAQSLGLNTCPMEGFDASRLSKFLALSRRKQQIVMVIAIGKQADSYATDRRWRRPLDATVTIL